MTEGEHGAEACTPAPADVERVARARATLQRWLDETPRYEGDDPRAVHYRLNVEVLETALAALTKPPALPKEGEEFDALIAAGAAQMRAVLEAGYADDAAFMSALEATGLDAALSSLPVRSGEAGMIVAWLRSGDKNDLIARRIADAIERGDFEQAQPALQPAESTTFGREP